MPYQGGVSHHRLPNWFHEGGSKSLEAQIGISGPGEPSHKHCGERIFFPCFTLAGEDGTPLKIPMEPQDHPIEKEHHLTTHHFLGLFILQGVVIVHIVIASGGFIGFC